MSFVHPGFLWALLAISIPIIVHLFNFRRFKKVYFSNVKFLEQLQLQTRRQSKLRHLLVLLMRILTIASLVFAFARPYIAAKEDFFGAESRVVSIYLDNSFSMAALSEEGNLLGAAKAKALEIASTYRATDKFQLLTNDFESSPQRLVSRETFLEQVRKVELSPSVKLLSSITALKQQSVFDEGHKQAHGYILSDFQKSICDFDKLSIDTGLRLFFVPFETKRPDNLYIDSVWFESPIRQIGRPVMLNVRIGASGSASYQGEAVRLFINGVQRGVANFDVQGGKTADVQIGFTIHETGLHTAMLELSDYPVSFDDRLYFSYSVSSSVPLLSINSGGQSASLQALFGNDSSFVLKNMDVGSIDFAAFSNQRVIFFNGLNQISSGLNAEILKYVEEGGSLVIFPGPKVQLQDYQQLFTSMQLGSMGEADTTSLAVGQINTRHPVFEGVFEYIPENMDMPKVKKHYPFTLPQISKAVNLLTLQNGKPFFIQFDYGKGRVFFCAVGLNEAFGNFHRHALFVPLMYNLALSSDDQSPLYYFVGGNQQVRVAGIEIKRDRVMSIRGEEMMIIPEQRLVNNVLHIYPQGQIQKAGHYDLLYDNQAISKLSYNYQRKESLLESYKAGELESTLNANGIANGEVLNLEKQSFEKYVERLGLGKSLVRWFLLFVLLCLATEVILLRFRRN